MKSRFCTLERFHKCCSGVLLLLRRSPAKKQKSSLRTRCITYVNVLGILIISGFVAVFFSSCSRPDSVPRPGEALMAGTSKREITPKEPLPMWGYASYHTNLSEGVLDPLFANVLVLQAGGKKIAVVSLDLGRTPSERILADIRSRIRRIGIEYSFIAASHTHHGPVLELSNERGRGKGRFDAAIRYYSQLEDTIVQAILDADSKLQPAKMAVGKVKLDNYNSNRQTEYRPAPVDEDLAEMRFDDFSGKPLAILVNFAAHPTLVPESLRKFSADYPGVLERIVEKDTGAEVLFIQGAAGDLAPNGEDYEKFGSDLAKAVDRLNSSLKTEAVVHPTLQLKEEKFVFESRANLNNPKVRHSLDHVFFPELIANYADEYDHGVRPRLTMAVLNDEIALVGVSGEFFCNHALRLKERARMKQLFFFGYCNGYDQYFPTIEAVAEGGYGTDGIEAPAAVGAGEQIMDAALIGIYEMRESPDGTPGL
jgi:neutral ceramidase